MPRIKSIKDVPSEILEDISRHRHETEIAQIERRTDWGYPVTHLCVRCGSYRYETVDLQGNVSNYSYLLSDEYRAVLDLGITRAEARLELLDRARRRLRQRHLRAV